MTRDNRELNGGRLLEMPAARHGEVVHVDRPRSFVLRILAHRVQRIDIVSVGRGHDRERGAEADDHPGAIGFEVVPGRHEYVGEAHPVRVIAHRHEVVDLAELCAKTYAGHNRPLVVQPDIKAIGKTEHGSGVFLTGQISAFQEQSAAQLEVALQPFFPIGYILNAEYVKTLLRYWHYFLFSLMKALTSPVRISMALSMSVLVASLMYMGLSLGTPPIHNPKVSSMS